MSADLKPCPFCEAAIKHIESPAKSFNPPRIFHEYHHPRSECMFFDGIIASFSDDPVPRLKWIEAWNRRAAPEPEPVAFTLRTEISDETREALKAIDDSIRAGAQIGRMIVGGAPEPRAGVGVKPMPRGGIEPDWQGTSLTYYRRYRKLRKAAQAVIDQMAAIHDNDPYPLKYRAPFGAIAGLSKVLDENPDYKALAASPLPNGDSEGRE